jgi:purine-binding chemotaxis protein CheW
MPGGGAMNDTAGTSRTTRAGARQLVAFVVGAERFAIDIARVQEIVKPLPLTVVPHMPPGFSGVVRLRDEVVVVADLHARFDFPKPQDDGETHIIILAGTGQKVGVVVDAVSEVIRVAPAMLGPPPAFHGGVPVACLDGIARVGDDLVGVLDVDALFPPAETPTLPADAPEPGPVVATTPAPEPAPTPAPEPVVEARPATGPVAETDPAGAPPADAGWTGGGTAYFDLYRDVGSLARYINLAHRSFAADLELPNRTVSAHLGDLPTANDVLMSVTQETEIATMQVLANSEETAGGVAHLEALLSDLEQAVPAASEGRARVCDLAERMRAELEHLRAVQNDTLMALSFQDLTGQKIAQVIALMGEVEERILGLVVTYGMAGADHAAQTVEQRQVERRIQDLKDQAEGGPLRQDRVDGLLAEFGF